MSADEFDSYDIDDPPVSLAFHLREFNVRVYLNQSPCSLMEGCLNQATIALAESLSVALDMQFTGPTSPIYIVFNTDSADSEFLFIISTTQSVYDSSSASEKPRALNLLKRDRGDDQNADDAQGTPRAAKKRLVAAASPPKTSTPSSQHEHPVSKEEQSNDDPAPSASRAPEEWDDPVPLFMPGASQLSNNDLDVLRSCGLGIEHMDFEEFEAMMAADGEEVGTSTAVGGGVDGKEARSDQGEDAPGKSTNGDNGAPKGEDAEMDDEDIIWPLSQVPVSENGKVNSRSLSFTIDLQRLS